MEFVSCSLTSLQNVEIFKVGLLVKYVFLTERKICEEKSWIFTCYLRQNSFCVHDTHFMAFNTHDTVHFICKQNYF